MKIDLVEYITAKTPEAFLRHANELLEAAYFAAWQHAETHESPEQRRILGQERHYRQNAALRVAGQSAGLIVAAPNTEPKGERYSIVAAEDIRFGRIAVPFHDRIPRFAKHRGAVAALNERLEPVNLSLFDPPATRPSDGLGCMIVTVNPHRRDVQSVPSQIIVGVPYTSLKGWHLFEPLPNVLAAYHRAVEMEVPDLAWVKLKKQLNGAEE